MTLIHRSRRLLAATTIALVLVGATAACGSEGSDGSADKTTTSADKATTDDGDTSTTSASGDGPTTTVDNGDRSRQAYIDAFVEGFDSDGETFSKENAECVGDHFIDVIGFDKIKSSELTPAEFGAGNGDDFPETLGIDEDKASELYDQFEACDIDLAAAFVKAYGATGTPLDADAEACLEKAITDEALRTSFVNGFLGKDDTADPLDAASACLATGTDGGGPTTSTLAPN
jgi:hypothetical protein